MTFKVIDTETGKDITNDFYWVLRPSGDLYYLCYEDLIGYPGAEAVFSNNINK